MSFIFGRKAEEYSKASSDDAPRMTQEKKAMDRIDLPFAKFLGESTSRALLQEVGMPPDDASPEEPQDDSLPPFPDDPEEPAIEPEFPPDPDPQPDVVIPDPEPLPVPDPQPAPRPTGDDVAKVLDQMTNMIEQMNKAVMSRVDALEETVRNRSKEIRETFYQSHLDTIEVSRKLKQAMHEAELMDLEIQKKHLEILDTTEDKSIERASKIKGLGIFGN